eukprot:2057322-Pyramimonas_sp.AAC.1
MATTAQPARAAYSEFVSNPEPSMHILLPRNPASGTLSHRQVSAVDTLGQSYPGSAQSALVDNRS